MKHKEVRIFDRDSIQARQRNGKYIRAAKCSPEQCEAILSRITDRGKNKGALRSQVQELLVAHNNQPQRFQFDTTGYNRVNANLKKGAINGVHYRLVEYKRHFQLWEFEPCEE